MDSSDVASTFHESLPYNGMLFSETAVLPAAVAVIRRRGGMAGKSGLHHWEEERRAILLNLHEFDTGKEPRSVAVCWPVQYCHLKLPLSWRMGTGGVGCSVTM
jgi:hypothetical protein